jgi:hypothetical protein
LPFCRVPCDQLANALFGVRQLTLGDLGHCRRVRQFALHASEFHDASGNDGNRRQGTGANGQHPPPTRGRGNARCLRRSFGGERAQRVFELLKVLERIAIYLASHVTSPPETPVDYSHGSIEMKIALQDYASEWQLTAAKIHRPTI